MAQVVAHHAEIEATQTNIVTVSFGTPYWANAWLQETQSPFPFLVDTDRRAYHAYGLESSLWRSWSPATLRYYATAKVQKRETFAKRGDPHQLGGDFIIDPQGVIHLAHPSREPVDRPSVAKILAILHNKQ